MNFLDGLGVCDCCDGSDEILITKCSNVCAAAHAKEKQMIEKMSAAYKAGSVIRSYDIERIEKSREALSKTVDPLKAKGGEMRKALDALKDIKMNGEKLNAELYESAYSDVRVEAENLLELQSIPDAQMARLMKSLFDVLDMRDYDVRSSLIAAGIMTSEQPLHDRRKYDDETRFHRSESTQDRNTGVDEEGHYADDDLNDSVEKEGSSEVADDGEALEDSKGAAESEAEAEAEGAEHIDEIFHCSLQQHVDDPRLRHLCKLQPLDNATPEEIQKHRALAAVASLDNARSLLLHLLKTKELYPEMQLLFGHYRMMGTYEGAVDFYKEHKKDTDTKICPSAWVTGGGGDICSLNDKLSTLYDTLKTIPGMSPDSDIDLSSKEKELKDIEAELEDAERSMLEYEDYSDQLEYLALKDKCFIGKEGKFSYNVCILDKLTQSDSENSHADDVTLGHYSSIESNNNTGGIIMHFTEGTNCWAFGPRTADVFISCGPVQKIISSSEPTTCYYTFEVESPSACTERFAQINGIF